MFFITKPATIDLFIFIEKYRKKTLCLTKKYQASLQENEFLVLMKRKTVIQKKIYLLSDLVVELQQLYEMYCANENVRDNKKMKYFLEENFKESICFPPSMLN